MSTKSAGALQQQVAATAHDVVVAAAAARAILRYDRTTPRQRAGREGRGEGRGERRERGEGE